MQLSVNLVKQSVHRIVAQIEFIAELSHDVARVLVWENFDFFGMLPVQLHLEHANGLGLWDLGSS